MNNSLYTYGLIKQAGPSGMGDDGYGLGSPNEDRAGIPLIHNTDPNSVFNFWLDEKGGLDLTPTPQWPSQGRGSRSGPAPGQPGHGAPHRLSPRLEAIFGQDSYTRHGTGQAPYNGAMKTYIPSSGTYERIKRHGTDDKGRNNLFSGTTPAAMRRRFARHSLTPVKPQYNEEGKYLGTPTAVGEKGGPTFFKHRGIGGRSIAPSFDVVDPYWEEHKKNYMSLTHASSGLDGPTNKTQLPDPAWPAAGPIRPRYYSGPTPADSLARDDTPKYTHRPQPPTTAALRGMYAGLGLDNRPDWNTFKKHYSSFVSSPPGSANTLQSGSQPLMQHYNNTPPPTPPTPPPLPAPPPPPPPPVGAPPPGPPTSP